MDIIFTRSLDRGDRTVVAREDGVRLSVPVFGPLDPFPHDLAHYVVELELGLHGGLWDSVAAGGIFDGMAILEGRQQPHARERSRAVLAANHREILFAEVVVEAALRAAKGERLEPDPLPVESPVVPSRTRADRDALVARLHPALEAMCERWRAIPLGGTYLVVWPDRPLRPNRLLQVPGVP